MCIVRQVVGTNFNTKGINRVRDEGAAFLKKDIQKQVRELRRNAPAAKARDQEKRRRYIAIQRDGMRDRRKRA